jgi:S-adenosylmethionine:diacylglycerol 3-amino-3-carboxypropyl transferase
MTPPTLVIWTVAARRQLRQALAAAACRQGTSAITGIMNDLIERLRCLFPGATGIVAQQQFVGFRPRDDEFILLVEVDGTARAGRHASPWR